MKISVDDKELFTLSEIQKKVIKNDIHEDFFEEEMRRRLHYILIHKYEQCFTRLKNEWDPILKNKYESIPTNNEEYAKLIFSQPEYKSKKEKMTVPVK